MSDAFIESNTGGSAPGGGGGEVSSSPTPTSPTGGGSSGGGGTTVGTSSGVSWNQWAVAILQGLGAPVNQSNIQAMVAWMGGEGTRAGNNPLATTYDMGGGNQTRFNSVNVRNYNTFDIGLEATLRTLRLGFYSQVVAALVRGTSVGELEGLVVASPWGTQRFAGNDGSTVVSGNSDGSQNAPSSSATTGAGAGPAGGSANPLWKPPPGGEVLVRNNGSWVLRYQVYPGVFVEWKTRDQEALERAGYDVGSATKYRKLAEGTYTGYLHWKENGDLFEIADTLETFGVESLEQWYELMVTDMFGGDPAALEDPGIQGVLLQLIQNPDMGALQLTHLIKGTEYAKQQTEAAAIFNDLSPAEQQARIMNMARQLAVIHRNKMGLVQGQFITANDPWIMMQAQLVVSGQKTKGAVTNEIEETAAGIAETPFARETRQEGIDAGQFDADIEDNALRLERMAANWGVNLTPDAYKEWATAIALNNSTDADFQNVLEEQASIMFPNRPTGMRTIDWAQPWINTLARTLEVGIPNLNDDRLQQALQSGMNVFDFQKQLMQTPEWMETENAMDSLTGAFGQLSSQMGFS